MKHEKLNDLCIDPSRKSRPSRSLWAIFLVVGLLTAGAIYYAAARWLEQRWPILGHLLGPAQAPVYPDSRETHDIVRNAFDLDRRHDDGSGDG